MTLAKEISLRRDKSIKLCMYRENDVSTQTTE